MVRSVDDDRQRRDEVGQHEDLGDVSAQALVQGLDDVRADAVPEGDVAARHHGDVDHGQEEIFDWQSTALNRRRPSRLLCLRFALPFWPVSGTNRRYGWVAQTREVLASLANWRAQEHGFLLPRHQLSFLERGVSD